jgi:hypothetical protein
VRLQYRGQLSLRLLVAEALSGAAARAIAAASDGAGGTGHYCLHRVRVPHDGIESSQLRRHAARSSAHVYTPGNQRLAAPLRAGD